MRRRRGLGDNTHNQMTYSQTWPSGDIPRDGRDTATDATSPLPMAARIPRGRLDGRPNWARAARTPHAVALGIAVAAGLLLGAAALLPCLPSAGLIALALALAIAWCTPRTPADQDGDSSPLDAMLPALEAMQDAVMVICPDMTVLWANDEQAGLAISDGPLTGRRCCEVICGRSTPCEQCTIVRAMRTLAPERATAETASPQSRATWQEVTSSPILDASGGLVGVLRVSRDVTALQQVEKALRESERDYRQLVQNANSIILRMDTEGTVTFFNAFAERFFGFTAEEIIGRNAVGTIVPETETSGRDLARLLADLCRNPEQYATNENENCTSDGRRVWVAWTNSAVINEAGEPIGALSVGNDITAHKQAEADLRERHRELEQLFAAIPDALIYTDAEHRVTQVSPAFTRLYGYSPESIAGEHISLLYADPGDARVCREAGDLAGRTCSATHRRIDGSTFESEAVNTAVHNARGDLIGYLSIIRDVTEQKRAQQALRMMQFAVEHASVAVYWTSASGRFVYVNSAACRSVGYQAHDLLRMSVADIDPNFPVDGWPEHWAELKRAGALVFRTSHRNRDGRVFPVEITAHHVDFEGREFNFAFVRDLTDHEQVELALRESEDCYRALSSAATEGVLIHDKATIVDCNEAICRIFGYEHSELIGADVFSLGAPESRSVLRENAAKATARPYEAVGLHKDGTRFPVEITGRDMPFRGRTRRVVTVRDISERKQAEEAARQSEKRYRILAENARDVIWMCDFQLNFTYVSPSVETLRGYTSEEAQGHALEQTLTPPSAALARQVSEELVSGSANPLDSSAPEQARVLELEMTRKDGSTVWTEVTMTLARDAEGKPTGIIGITRDIAERRQAEEERRRLARAVEQTGDAILIIDADGRILYANRAAETLSEYSRTQLQGASLHTLADNPRQRGAIRRVWAAARDQRLWQGRVALTRPDGTGYYCDVTMSAVQDADGLIVNHVITARDVTAQLGLEDQLRHTQKMEALGALAGGVAHDFNNMLTAIRGYAELLKNRDLQPEDTVRAAETIERAAERAGSLTSQLLGFARKGMLQKTPVDMHAAVNEVIALLSHTIDKRVSLVTDFSLNRAVVIGDPNQLQQVLLNLALNARDAMPDGGRLIFSTSSIDITTAETSRHPEARPGRYVAVSVSDTGTGIAPDLFDRIFDPFVTTKPEGDGSGMGLPMVYGIVSAHGGWVEVSTRQREGSVFTVLLPAAKDQAAAQRAGGTRSETLLGSGRILVVDDEEIVREILSDMLRRLGYEVIEAEAGAEAVEVYGSQREQIDAVILDLVMPGMSGGDTFDALRAIDPSVRALLSTGHSPDGVTQALLDRGVKGLVPKPYGLNELARALHAALTP